MSKNSNDNIEDFFRKGLSQETPFMEEDWKKMEKLLNAHDAGRAAAAVPLTAKVAGGATVLLLLLISGYLLLNDHASDASSKSTQTSITNLSTENQAASGPKALESKDGNPGADLISVEDTKVTRDNHEQGVEKRPASGVVGSRHDRRFSFGKLSRTITSSELTGIGAVPSQMMNDRRPSAVNERRTADQQGASEFQATITRMRTANASEVAQPEKLTPEQLTIVSSSSDSSVVASDKPVNEAPMIRKVPSRFSITAVYAPDYSATEMGNFSSPGRSMGILINYDILKRLSVSSGLFRSAKLYTGYGSDYTPPEGYWQRRTNGIVPDEIIGKCDVWEIPLMFRFAVIERPKSRIYVTGGMTTYLITSERYDYCFNNPNPGAASGWSTEKSTTYPFNVGYVGAGFEQRLSPHFSVGVEPFVKIPFKGMGWSNVNIYSAGAYFSLHYRFLKKLKTVN